MEKVFGVPPEQQLADRPERQPPGPGGPGGGTGVVGVLLVDVLAVVLVASPVAVLVVTGALLLEQGG